MRYVALANFISAILHPLLMPIYLTVVMLFVPRFSSEITLVRKLFTLGIVFSFFFIIPVNILFILKYFDVVKDIKLRDTSERFLLFFITTLSAVIGLRILSVTDAPGTLIFIMRGVVVALLLVSIISVFGNISLHTTSIGCAFSIILLLSMMFSIDLSIWAVVFALLSGVVAWARLYLECHGLRELAFGFILGFASIFVSFLLYITF